MEGVNVTLPLLSCIYRVMYWNLKRILALLVATLFVGSIFYYSYYQSRAIIAGPTITLTIQTEGEIFSDSLAHITGTAIHAKELTLDGRAIFVDLSGNFNEQLLLFPGYNIIEVVAKDADGREEKKTIGVVWSGTTSPAFRASSTSTPLSTSTGAAIIQ
jgi:hypothetical protein